MDHKEDGNEDNDDDDDDDDTVWCDAMKMHQLFKYIW